MKKKTINPFLIGALVLGALCIFGIKYVMDKDKEEANNKQMELKALAEKAQAELEEAKKKAEEAIKRPTASIAKAETKSVVCFKAPLQSRTEINRTMLELREIPIELVPEAVITDLKDAVGRFTVRSVDAKEIATTTKLKTIHEIGGMSYRVTPGMRAISIQVSAVGATGNLITDGDSVDILLTEKDSGGTFLRTRIFLQSIRILSFHASPENESTAGLPKTAPDTATIEVTPEQAEGIIQAKSMGEMSLVLRSVKDNVQIRTRGFERTELSDDIGVIQTRSKRTLKKVQDDQAAAKDAASKEAAASKDVAPVTVETAEPEKSGESK